MSIGDKKEPNMLKIATISLFLLIFTIISPTFAGENPLPKNAINNQLCGNGVCNKSEQSLGSCPIDCDQNSTKNEACGDGSCSSSERSSGTCSQDCVWGTGCGGG